MELKRVVVTGLGTISPLGNSVDIFWGNLINGVSGAAPITKFNAEHHRTRFACEVRDFDPVDFGIDKKEARKYDLYTQFALASTGQAMRDAGLDSGRFDRERAGVVWGSGIGGLQTFHEEVSAYRPERPQFSPYFIPKMIVNMASGVLSIQYGLMGPNFTTVTACASSTHAIIQAFNLIRLGKADVMVTGGSEASVNETGVAGFNSMRAISTRNDDPATASRPFDKDRDGFVMAEGSGTLVLEEYNHALRRGARIYGEILGGGMSADAYHMTAPDPEGTGARLVMKWAVEDAGLQLTDVDYINVHGTSTPLGDIAEPKAILGLFGDHACRMSLSATKSMTGHLLGAAGAIEAIATLLALREGIIPPTINHFSDDPDIDGSLDFTFHQARKRDIRIALSNTFGFGGHNGTVAFKKYQ